MIRHLPAKTPYRLPVISFHNREEALLSMRYSRRADLQNRLDAKHDWEAGMELGHLYRLGIDGVCDPANAEKTYRRAYKLIEFMDSKADSRIALAKALCHHHGWGLPINRNKAAPYFQRSRRLLSDECVDGDTGAAFDLAALFYGGFGGDKDVAEAVRYYEMAARQFHILAMTLLADIYLHGPEQVRHSSRAADLYEKLAGLIDETHRHFIADAQFRLGALYYEGRGRPVDYEHAYIWFGIAAANDHAVAPARRQALEPFLSRTQLEGAQNRMRRWQPGQALPAVSPTYPSPSY